MCVCVCVCVCVCGGGGGGGGVQWGGVDCNYVNIHFFRDIMVFPPSKHIVAPSFHSGRDKLFNRAETPLCPQK